MSEGEWRARVDAAREQMRQKMLAADYTDDRDTYGDGYGNGLAEAIGFLDWAMEPRVEP